MPGPMTGRQRQLPRRKLIRETRRQRTLRLRHPLQKPKQINRCAPPAPSRAACPRHPERRTRHRHQKRHLPLRLASFRPHRPSAHQPIRPPAPPSQRRCRSRPAPPSHPATIPCRPSRFRQPPRSTTPSPARRAACRTPHSRSCAGSRWRFCVLRWTSHPFVARHWRGLDWQPDRARALPTHLRGLGRGVHGHGLATALPRADVRSRRCLRHP